MPDERRRAETDLVAGLLEPPAHINIIASTLKDGIKPAQLRQRPGVGCQIAAGHVLCRAIVEHGLDDLMYVVQAMTAAIASHGATLAPLMRKAGFRYVFLGIENILFHPLAGVLSAYGIGLAPLSQDARADAGRREVGDELLAELGPVRERLEAEARDALVACGVPGAAVRLEASLDIGYAGAETVLGLAFDSAPRLRETFEREHRRLFGYARPGHPLVAHQVRVQAASPAPELGPGPPAPSTGATSCAQ